MEKSQNYNKSESPLNFQLLKDRVYESIKERIINLSFSPGEQLFEKELGDSLGVSKSPIRDAFHRLEQEGLVYTIPFRGCFVSKLSIQEFKEIFQLRQALEMFCITESVALYTNEDIKGFRQVTKLAKNSLNEGNKDAAYAGHLDFHKLIITKLGNRSIENIYSNIEDRLKRYLNIAVKYMPNRVVISNEQHFEVLKAIERKDAILAAKELQSHLSTVLDDYLNCDEIRKLL